MQTGRSISAVNCPPAWRTAPFVGYPMFMVWDVAAKAKTMETKRDKSFIVGEGKNERPSQRRQFLTETWSRPRDKDQLLTWNRKKDARWVTNLHILTHQSKVVQQTAQLS